MAQLQLTPKERETIEKVKTHYKSVLEDCDKALKGELPFKTLQERITKAVRGLF